MFLKRSMMLGSLLFGAQISLAGGNPASVDYVKLSIDALRSELKAQINAITLPQPVPPTHLESQLREVIEKLDTLPVVTHHIGELFEGGLIFYLDESLQHGLVVSLTDLSSGIEWRNGDSGDRMTNAKGQGLHAGETNTRLIVSEQTIDEQKGKFAALLASNYQVSLNGVTSCGGTLAADTPCYGGWYLPSLYELLLLHANLKSEMSDAFYWSSSEASATTAWLVDFTNGATQVSEKSTKAHVRAIHAF